MNRWESCCLLGCSATHPCSHLSGLSLSLSHSPPHVVLAHVLLSEKSHGNLGQSNMFFLKVEGGPGAANDVANTIMQRFWDSALALEPPDEEFDSHRLVDSSL